MHRIISRTTRSPSTDPSKSGIVFYGNDGRRIVSSMTELEQTTHANKKLHLRVAELENENQTLKGRLASFEGPSKK